VAILRELNARAVAERGQQSLYIAGSEAPPQEYARYEKIAVEASRKLVAALKTVPDIAVGRVLAAQDPLERLAYAMVGPLESGVELGNLSARDFLRQPESDPQITVAEGLGTLVARWGSRVPVKLGTRVVRLDSTGSLVLVVTTSGQLQARTAIVTVPTGVLAGGPFGFAPPLSPARREAIAQLPMAAYNKIAISFGRRVFDTPADRSLLGLTRREQPFDAVVRPQGRDAAVVFVGGNQALQIEEEGSGAAMSFALSALAEIYGDALRGLVVRSHATRWGRDPYARGAWSMALPGHADKRLVLAQPHHDRIFFAGEATDPVGAARVGGAYASGVRAAREALAALGTRR
jgi:monoamine oxidase